jgi:rod shape determining protein RodA
MIINKKIFKNLDYGILFSVIAIVIIGIITIGSATSISSSYFKYQIAWFIVSLPIVFLILLVDYNSIGGYYKVIYFVAILLLILVLLFGSVRNNAKSWLGIGPFGGQPAEIAKLATIIALSKIMEEMENINTFKNLCKIAIYIIIPMVLIQLQPDAGTNMIFAVTMFGILFVAGLDLKFIYGITMAGVAAVGVLWQFNILDEYQKNRILVFLKPELDKLGFGYNAIMAKMAIGSGNFFGMGWGKGNLAGGNFIPESHTDFIFSVFAEEWGFLGILILMFLYFNIIIKSIKIARTSKDKFGSYMVVGILTMITFQILQNIGMDIGLMPITGIPLPFMSYGGSSLLTNLISIALILNVSTRRQKIDFSRG